MTPLSLMFLYVLKPCETNGDTSPAPGTVACPPLRTWHNQPNQGINLKVPCNDTLASQWTKKVPEEHEVQDHSETLQIAWLNGLQIAEWLNNHACPPKRKSSVVKHRQFKHAERCPDPLTAANITIVQVYTGIMPSKVESIALGPIGQQGFLRTGLFAFRGAGSNCVRSI